MEIALEKYPLICREDGFNLPVFEKKYRGSFEIIALILKTASEGASRFAIANRINTNYVLLEKYLNYLIKVGFVDVEPNGRQILYKTSEKGLEFLRLFHNLLKMFLEPVEARMSATIVCKSFHLKKMEKVEG